MSSPVVYSVTAAQIQALRAIKSGRQEWRVTDSLYRKGLVSSNDPREASITALGVLLLAQIGVT